MIITLTKGELQELLIKARVIPQGTKILSITRGSGPEPNLRVYCEIV